METEPISTTTAIIRGFSGRCPKCGQGKLLASFLKPVDECSVCHEKLSIIRADDGPAWLTILIVGHLLIPIIFTVGPTTEWPLWASMLLFCSIAVILMALILPRAKGVFMGILWKSRQPLA